MTEGRLDTLRDYVHPLLYGGVVLLLAGILLSLAHRRDLDASLAGVDAPLSDTTTVVLLDTHRHLSNAPRSRLAGLLAGDTCIRRAAYEVLLAFRPDREIAAALYALTPVRFDRGTVTGFERAALAWFGVEGPHLSSGETALLCHAAFDRDATRLGTAETLALRNTLLDALHERGTLSSTNLSLERARPLALAPDPRPIY